MKRRMLALALSLAMLFTLPGCTSTGAIAAEDLMKDVTAHDIAADADLTGDTAAALTGFGVELLQNSAEAGENTLVSPLSVLSALAMTANGARGDTLAQMEEAFGVPLDELNGYLYTYRANLTSTEKAKLHLANSIWFKDDESLSVEPDFLQTNADYYGAGAYKAPFDDSTKNDINNWVKTNTDGMIPEIVDEIPQDAVMYLVNALSFDAEWADIYQESQVREGIFTREDGSTQQAELMWSEESHYIEDDLAQGFFKWYAGGKGSRYIFAAILPNEGVSVEEYVDSLTGEGLNEMLTNYRSASITAAIPKFETEFDLELSEALQTMGMVHAFDGSTADFTALGHSTEDNICISRVLHRTFIAVDEKGTKAGAATAVEMEPESAMEMPDEYHEIILDRPFVYLIIDWDAKLPIFMGTVMEI